MARLLYIDCFSGVAGDMLLGAFLDAGVPEAALRQALGSLGVGHEIRIERVVRAGISAMKVDVVDTERAGSRRSRSTQPHDHAHGDSHEHAHDGHRTLHDVRQLVSHSNLSAAARDRANALFARLATAEAAIHGIPVDEVHLHEVGAVDSIIDVVGCVFALEWLGIDRVVASPLNVGAGTVTIAHGTFPVPAPATLRLLAGAPVYSAGPAVELVTPTGALVVSDYASAYGPWPAMRVEHIGYGAGSRDFPDRPNVVRVVIGQEDAATGYGQQTVVRIECEVDDMNPQIYGPVSDQLFALGALDVFLAAIQMKKGRPGVLVTVVAPEDRRAALIDCLFRETTTIGVRHERMSREVLARRFETVTVFGRDVRIKVAGRGEEVLNAAPEFDDCVAVASAEGQSLKVVQAEAMRVWMNRRASGVQ